MLFRSLKPDDANNFITPYKVVGDFTLDPASNMPGNGAITIPVDLSRSTINARGHKTPEGKNKFPLYLCESYYLEENRSIDFPNNVREAKTPDAVKFDENGINYRANYQLKDNSVTVKRSLTTDLL